MTSLDHTKQATTRVFVSYSRRDRAFVSKIVDALEAAADIEVFRDTDDILPTEEWKERLEQLIAEADTIVFALSPHSARSQVCSWEVDHALSLNKRVAPIVIREVEPDDVPASLSRYNYIFFTNRREFDASIGNLIAALNTDIGWIREHTRLGEVARRWAAQGGGRSQLLRGDDLAHAETWIAQQPANAPLPTADHRTFIAASRAAATRRQRTWITGSIAAAVVMAVVAVFALQQRNAAVESERVATEERDRAEQERNRAVRAEALAEQRAASELQAKEQAEKALQAATETASAMIKQIAVEFRDAGVPVATVGQILQAARGLLQSLAEQDSTRPELRIAMAEAYQEISATLLRQGDADAARAAAEQSVALTRALVAEDPGEMRWRQGLSSALMRLADALFPLGNFEAASATVTEALELARAALDRDATAMSGYLELVYLLQRNAAAAVTAERPDMALEALAEAEELGRLAVESHPDDSSAISALASTLTVTGIMIERVRGAAAAIEPYEEALALFDGLSSDDPVNTEWRRRKASTLSILATVYRKTGQHDRTRRYYAMAIETLNDLARMDPDDDVVRSDLAGAHAGLAETALVDEDLATAEEHFSAALEIFLALSEANPENIVMLGGIADGHARLAALYRRAGRIEDALQAYRAQLALLVRVSESTQVRDLVNADIAEARTNLGDALVESGDHIGAEEQFGDALALRLQLAELDVANTDRQRSVSLLHVKIANVRDVQGDSVGALRHYRSAVEISNRLLEHDGGNELWLGDRAFAALKVGKLLIRFDQLDAAARAIRSSVEGYVKLANAVPEDTDNRINAYVALLDLADIEERRGHQEAAIEAYRQAMEFQQALVDDEPQNTAWLDDLWFTNARLVDLHHGRGDTDTVIERVAAIVAIREALVAIEPESPVRRHDFLQALLALARGHARSGQSEDALADYARITSLVVRPPFAESGDDEFHAVVATAHREAGVLLADLGRLADALKQLLHAVNAGDVLLENHPGNDGQALALAKSLGELAVVHARMEERHDAHAACDRLIEVLEPFVGGSTASKEAQLEYVWAFRTKAALYRMDDALAEAAEMYGQSAAALLSVVTADPEDASHRRALNGDLVNLAHARLQLGDIPGAVQAFEQSAELLAAMAQQNPDDEELVRKRAETSLELGDALVRAQDVPRALDAYRVSLAMRQALLGMVPDDTTRQLEVAFVYWRFADVGENAAANWQIVVDMMAGLDAAGLLDAELQPWLAAAREHLAAASVAPE